MSSTGGTNLVDVLSRVLDAGVVIAGDIKIKIVDIELLSIQLRLVVASVDKACEMGLDWWRTNPELCPRRRARKRVRAATRAAIPHASLVEVLAPAGGGM
jgi:hypothetical protein